MRVPCLLKRSPLIYFYIMAGDSGSKWINNTLKMVGLLCHDTGDVLKALSSGWARGYLYGVPCTSRKASSGCRDIARGTQAPPDTVLTGKPTIRSSYQCSQRQARRYAPGSDLQFPENKRTEAQGLQRRLYINENCYSG
jgi:hypothetical protein